jgi:lipoprotein-anchoring transpeptidase ErfK/SrfK
MNTLTKIAAAALLMLGLGATPSEAGPFAGFRALLGGANANPSVTATVSISEQRMTLKVVDKTGTAQTFVWKVSTGKSGFETPTGAWKPTRLSIDHRSKTYDDAPMPFAVFFTGGYAIHATDAVGRLGKPASHGCVRLAPKNAKLFYQLVRASGNENATVSIVR